MHQDVLSHNRPDIRRRLREKRGVLEYTLKQLAESLKKRGRYIAGSRIVLVGFEGLSDETAKKTAEDIIAALRRYGAYVHVLSAQYDGYIAFESALRQAAAGAHAVLVDTNNRFFRALRPRELRDMGIETIIPTTLHP